MKKIISIRALLIALMLTFTFAIPALASVKTQAVPVEADQAVLTEPVTETASIDIAAPTSDAQDAAVETEVIDNKIDTVSEETDDVIEETAEEVVETASEVEAEDPPSPAAAIAAAWITATTIVVSAPLTRAPSADWSSLPLASM